jgi:hypothetical protein
MRIIVANPGRRGMQDDDRVLTCHAHQLTAAPGKFFLFDHDMPILRICESRAEANRSLNE